MVPLGTLRAPHMDAAPPDDDQSSASAAGSSYSGHEQLLDHELDELRTKLRAKATTRPEHFFALLSPESEAEFQLWYQRKVSMMHAVLTAVTVHILLYVRARAQDDIFVMVSLWCATMLGVLAQLYDAQRPTEFRPGSPRDLAQLYALAAAVASRVSISGLGGAVFLVIAARAACQQAEQQALAVEAIVQRMQQNPQVLVMLWGMAGLVIGSVRRRPYGDALLLLAIVLRIGHLVRVAGAGVAPVVCMTFLVPFGVGCLLGLAGEYLARQVWAHNERKLHALMREMKSLEGHVELVESIRRRELTSRKRDETRAAGARNMLRSVTEEEGAHEK